MSAKRLIWSLTESEDTANALIKLYSGIPLTEEDLDCLTYSKNWRDRESLAGKGHRLATFVTDECEQVRAAVAMCDYGLPVLVADKNPIVRYAVALQGYDLDILINDEDYSVREAAKEKMRFLINEKEKEHEKQLRKRGLI